LFECEHPWNCPHGRPTVVRVPRGKLEEWFLRRAP
jgi:DNA mismatch repair ATPase MutL